MQHDWNMKSYVLQTRHLDVSHTEVNIGHVLQEIVTEWKLPTENEIELVTDNASNMDIAAKTADLHPHIGCFAHTVGRMIRKDFFTAHQQQLLCLSPSNDS